MGLSTRGHHMERWGLWLCWGLMLAALLAPCRAQATLELLREAQLQMADAPAIDVQLPHFVQQPQSGLLHLRWTLELPPSVHTQQLPALLLPQPIQGLTVSIGQETVFALPSSTPNRLYHWYRPVLIPLPHALLEGHSPPLIHIEQTGHLRGWYVAPVLLGELNELQTWHDRFLLLSSTLPTTVNWLSVLVGLFVLAVGWRTQAIPYIFGGLTTVVWGILYSLALMPDIPMDTWFLWRLMLYACTGNLIYVVLRFQAALFRQPLSERIRWPLCWFLQVGWLVFALVGPSAESMLDVVWTGMAVVLYILGSGWLVTRGIRHREYANIVLLGLHGLLTALLAWHDYGLQSGRFPTHGLDAWPMLWQLVGLQPIYLTHLSLPMYVVLSLGLLVQDHLQHLREQSQHEHALQAQRDRITRDIHDGVGARLNLMLWRTRTAPLMASQLQDELERTIEELRFAINPSETAPQTLTDALNSLCQRSARWGQPLGLSVEFHAPPTLDGISAEKGLHLYKAAHEGLSNALRHSRASLIHLRLTAHAGCIVLTLVDNGMGIPGWDSDHQTPINGRSTAMGLRSMQHRMRALGGHCDIRSDATGTQLTFELPQD